MKKKIIIILSSVFTMLLVCVVAFFIYVGDYYHATDEVLQYLESNEIVEVKKDEDIYFNTKQDTNTGIIFYPGAKVETEAYSKLLFKLAENGVFCVLVDMPFNLAIFDVNAADDIIKSNPQIENWYLMGHSLGGAMASSYVSKNKEKVKGIILLAAYSTSDITEAEVLSIYGENDLVLSKDKYVKNINNLPQNFTEVVIKGGNHSGFALYGEQKGDGKLEITQNEQINITVFSIINFVKS